MVKHTQRNFFSSLLCEIKLWNDRCSCFTDYEISGHGCQTQQKPMEHDPLRSQSCQILAHVARSLQGAFFNLNQHLHSNSHYLYFESIARMLSVCDIVDILGWKELWFVSPTSRQGMKIDAHKSKLCILATKLSSAGSWTYVCCLFVLSIQSALDFMNPCKSLGYNSLNDGQLGLLGVVTSSISIYDDFAKKSEK